MALTKEDVVSALRNCVDPEIPVNIVDLGLVYQIDLKQDASMPGADVHVRMTLTSPNCPMSQSISNDVRKQLAQLPNVDRAQVEIVWEPTWNPEMITPEGRRHLNLPA